MSEIRAYLEAEVLTPKGWLRREPKATHQAVLAAVREAVVEEDKRTVYNDEVEQFVHAVAGDLPAWSHHGSGGRDPLVSQLGSECYVARCIITDEKNAAAEAELRAEGYDALTFEEGRRYLVRFGTVYSGYRFPVYGKAHEVRAVRFGEKIALLPKGAWTRGFDPSRADAVLAKVSL